MTSPQTQTLFDDRGTEETGKSTRIFAAIKSDAVIHGWWLIADGYGLPRGSFPRSRESQTSHRITPRSAEASYAITPVVSYPNLQPGHLDSSTSLVDFRLFSTEASFHPLTRVGCNPGNGKL